MVCAPATIVQRVAVNDERGLALVWSWLATVVTESW